MSKSSIWPIDRTLSGDTIPGQRWPGIDDNEGVLCYSQSFNITGASLSDCLVSNPGHSSVGGGSYFSAEMQSVYSIAPAYRTERDRGRESDWGTCGVMVNVVENENSDPSSNPVRGCLHFLWERYEFNYSSLRYKQLSKLGFLTLVLWQPV